MGIVFMNTRFMYLEMICASVFISFFILESIYSTLRLLNTDILNIITFIFIYNYDRMLNYVIIDPIMTTGNFKFS